MRVDTIEQFKVLQFIRETFKMDCISVELQDRCSLKVTDERNQSLIFAYDHGEIKQLEQEDLAQENSARETEWER